MLTNARIALAVADHDEPRAERALADYLAMYPADCLPAERQLRRSLALGYVLSFQLRGRWDSVPLSTAEQQARSIARMLVTARDGASVRAGRTLDPGHVFTTLPLPWSVELACRLHGQAAVAAETLIRWLIDHVGVGVRPELRRLADNGDPRVVRSAKGFLAKLPIPPADRLHIGVLGPMEICRSGVAEDAEELHRARVRELLSILVVEPVMSREGLIDALWPELDLESGSRNLRVTLAYLRRLLEPDRGAAEATYFLRTDSTGVRLFRGSELTCDLWQAERLTDQAAQCRRNADSDPATTHLAEAIALWRGEALPDLRRMEPFVSRLARIDLTRLSALVTLGELRLAAGHPDEAVACAEQAVILDPYNELHHRLRIVSLLACGDVSGAHAAAKRLRGVLDELGVPPDPATRILLDRATVRKRPILTTTISRRPTAGKPQRTPHLV